MPLLNRLTDDSSDNGHQDDQPSPASISPIVPGRSGRPSYSLEALRERVEAQFQEETANRPDILLDLDNAEKRRAMLLEIAEYVLAQEIVILSAQDKTTLIDKAYRNLFTFGPLDTYLADDAVTEITINGPHDVHVRRGMGQLESVDVTFDDRLHLENIIKRVITTGGAVLSETDPFLEIGVVLVGRPARISLISPPISPEYSLEIRLHPREPLTLEALHTRFRAVPPQAAALLTALLTAKHGLLIVGDVSVGKTTLASALLHTFPQADDTPAIIAVERAAEMHLPDHATRRIPGLATSDFVSQIQAALDEKPVWVVIDEIRGDEAAAVWDALTRENAPHYLWIFRGATQPDRLRSALNMVIRKQNQAVDQAVINRALAKHLPFIAILKSIDGAPRLHMIAEMVLENDDQALLFRPLLCDQDGGWLVTENRPTRPLDLPDDFWA